MAKRRSHPVCAYKFHFSDVCSSSLIKTGKMPNSWFSKSLLSNPGVLDASCRVREVGAHRLKIEEQKWRMNSRPYIGLIQNWVDQQLHNLTVRVKHLVANRKPWRRSRRKSRERSAGWQRHGAGAWQAPLPSSAAHENTRNTKTRATFLTRGIRVKESRDQTTVGHAGWVYQSSCYAAMLLCFLPEVKHLSTHT